MPALCSLAVGHSGRRGGEGTATGDVRRKPALVPTFADKSRRWAACVIRPSHRDFYTVWRFLFCSNLRGLNTAQRNRLPPPPPSPRLAGLSGPASRPPTPALRGGRQCRVLP